MNIYISTLGNFDIKNENTSLLKDSTRQYRLYKLFQYFITFRNKKLLPETIIDNLFPDNESCDPKNVLRTQIFRLRQSIKTMLPPEEDESKYMSINFNNGYYSLEIGDKVTLDIDEFEAHINKGDSVSNTDNIEAIKHYKNALELYKGIYLSENAYEVWIVPTRNYYNRLYLKTLFKLIEILKEQYRNEEIIELCEQALVIENYEEVIHIYLMEAMLNLGQINNAMSHYEYTITTLEKEVGTKSSPGLRNIYRKIQNYYNEKGQIDISSLNYKLEDDYDKGALLCDVDYFKFLYNIQKRKSNRNNEYDYIGLITLSDRRSNYDANEVKKWGKQMSLVLKDSLRVGDAITFWNDIQVLILLHDVRGNGLEKIENRIRKNLRTYGLLDINISFKSLYNEDENILFQSS